MVRKRTIFTAAVATIGVATAGEVYSTTTDQPNHKADAAAHYLVERITHHQKVTFDPAHEAITHSERVPNPLQHDGKYYELSGTVEHPRLTLLEHPQQHDLHRMAGTQIISHEGVVEMNPISDLPAVNVELRNGTHQQLAIAHAEPVSH